jgi:hypothetical protein
MPEVTECGLSAELESRIIKCDYFNKEWPISNPYMRRGVSRSKVIACTSPELGKNQRAHGYSVCLKCNHLPKEEETLPDEYYGLI